MGSFFTLASPEAMSTGETSTVIANPEIYLSSINQYAQDAKLPEIARCMQVVSVPYQDYRGNEKSGKIVINRDAAADIKNVFAFMKQIGYPIKSVQPVSNFDWSDDRSMRADNTSGYNYRTITNSHHLSNHAFGFAIDLNPNCNPDVRSGKLNPPTAVYPSHEACAIEGELGQKVQAYFKAIGWCWGGDYTSHRDLQHFEKLPEGFADCSAWYRKGALRNSNGPYCR
jgi:peptidoglycan L-alanyl-D-glutamate endopeptidase CwlK